MLKVGITGGIGSGKTVVSRIFEVLGLPVYYADAEAKKLMQEDGVLRRQITDHFGAAAYRNHQLDRAWLAAQVFGDESKVRLLNSLVHPVVIAHAARWMDARRQEQRYPYVLKEAALFFESGSAGEMDYIVGVFAPRHLRLQRVMHRDGAGRQDVLARMDKQIDETLKMKLCDFVVTNDEQQLLIPQVLQVHQALLNKQSAI